MKAKFKNLLMLSQVLANVNKGSKSNAPVFNRIQPGLHNLTEVLNTGLMDLTSSDLVGGQKIKLTTDQSTPSPKREPVKDIRDVIKTFQDALDYKGETIEQFTARTVFDEPHEVAYKRQCVINFALNQGQVLFYDGSTTLYYPFFEVVEDSSAPSGFRFSFDDWSVTRSYSLVGSRLCFKTRELAEYAGKQFTEEFAPSFIKVL